MHTHFGLIPWGGIGTSMVYHTKLGLTSKNEQVDRHSELRTLHRSLRSVNVMGDSERKGKGVNYEPITLGRK